MIANVGIDSPELGSFQFSHHRAKQPYAIAMKDGSVRLPNGRIFFSVSLPAAEGSSAARRVAAGSSRRPRRESERDPMKPHFCCLRGGHPRSRSGPSPPAEGRGSQWPGEQPGAAPLKKGLHRERDEHGNEPLLPTLIRSKGRASLGDGVRELIGPAAAVALPKAAGCHFRNRRGVRISQNAYVSFGSFAMDWRCP